ncbi:MAG TPA: SPOR domain-containing protein [Blastocatellia bacterium]|nr:SPOR domain-containing protein [Blastocatellia bacterium]
MRSKRIFFSAFFTLLAIATPAHSGTDTRSGPFTLQIAAFPDAALAERFINQLIRIGERPVRRLVKLPGRGVWIRVFIGPFRTAAAARRYGEGLVARKIVADFMVRPVREMGWPSRNGQTEGERLTAMPEAERQPSAVSRGAEAGNLMRNAVKVSRPSGIFGPRPLALPLSGKRYAVTQAAQTVIFHKSAMTAWMLPKMEKIRHDLAPAIDTSSIPRPDPVLMAFSHLARATHRGPSQRGRRGGLWLSGNLDQGLARLRWIAGEDAHLLLLDYAGKVHLDTRLLARRAGVDDPSAFAAPMKVIEYLYANEGLLLLTQLTQGQYRYCLHIGSSAPTLSETVAVTGSLNLDNNYDSRINPYRRDGKKLGRERPPEGVDALIAINPAARWFNLKSHRFVPPGNIAFHELAEAYAKLELGLDYLPQAHQPGAHGIAVERELILQAQRPFSDMVVTTGSNRVLRSEEEYRQFYSETGQR